MRIGEEGNINNTSPVIIGEKTFGIRTNGVLEIYDGIVKGKSGTIDGTITKQEPNTIRKQLEEVINGQKYHIEYLETDTSNP